MKSELPTSEPMYLAARKMVNHKETEIEKALDHHYPDGWDLDHLARHGVMTYNPDGTETFSIAGKDLLMFGQMTTDVEITDSYDVRCRLAQSVARLYEHD